MREIMSSGVGLQEPMAQHLLTAAGTLHPLCLRFLLYTVMITAPTFGVPGRINELLDVKCLEQTPV